MSEFRGKRVAVDGYGWLHKGAYTCSTDLCLKRPTDKFVTFFLHRLQVLINHGLVPTIVFDGGQLPMKREENESRRSSRKQNYDKAMSLWKVGKQVAAEEYFQRAVHIGPDHAKQVIDALKLKGVHYIVAPYEADSQMAFLAQSGRVDLVITEDSDLLAYSCPEVLFKLDKEGNVQHVCFDELINSSKFAGFTKLMFTEMCILSGCDFLQSVPGIGMKRAYTFIKKLRSHSAVIKRLKYSGFKVPSTYELDFRCALKVFHHQTVWDPLAAQLRHLTPLGEDMAAAQEAATDEAADGGSSSTAPASHPEYLGPHYSNVAAGSVASGDIHPTSKELLRAFPRRSSAPPEWWLKRNPHLLTPIATGAQEWKFPKTSFQVDAFLERRGEKRKGTEVLPGKNDQEDFCLRHRLRTRRIRMKLTLEQRRVLRKWCHGVRHTYNAAVAAAAKAVRERKHSISKAELRQYIRFRCVNRKSELLTTKRWLRGVPQEVRDSAVDDVIHAYSSHWAKGGSSASLSLKHRGKGQGKGALTIQGRSVTVVDKKSIKFLPSFLRWHVELSEEIPVDEQGNLEGAITLVKERRHWFVHVPWIRGPARVAARRQAMVALDPGARNFLAFYGRQCFGTIQAALEVHSLPRKMASKKKRSKGESRRIRRAMKRGVERMAHRKESLVNDMHFKVASFLTRHFLRVISPKLRFGQILSSSLPKPAKRALLRVRHGRFRTRLKDKAETAGCVIIDDDEHLTSATCSRCGTVREVGGDDTFLCWNCGLTLCRDINAAKNIYLKRSTAEYQTVPL